MLQPVARLACQTSSVPPERDVAAFEARAVGYEHGWLGRLHHDIADRTTDLARAVTSTT